MSDPNHAPELAGAHLGYHVEHRRRLWPWVLLLLICHVAGSYAVAGAWAVHQAIVHKPQDLPVSIGILLPVLSPLVLLRGLWGLLFFTSRTWDTAVTTLGGYALGFLVTLAFGTWQLLRPAGGCH